MRHCLNPFVASLSGLLMLISSGGASAAALPMAVTDEPSRVAAIAAAADAPLLYAVGLPPSLTEIAGSSGGVDVFSAGAKETLIKCLNFAPLRTWAPRVG